MSRSVATTIAIATLVMWPAYAFCDNEASCSAAHVRAQVLNRDTPERLLERRSTLRTCSTLSCPRSIRDACATWLKDVENRIPTIVIHVEGSAVERASVLVDGKSEALGRAIEIDPGEHTVLATNAGAKQSRTAVVHEGDRSHPVDFAFDPPPDEPIALTRDAPVNRSDASERRDLPVASWISFGAGAVGLATFAAAGVVALVANHDLDGACDGSECRASTSADAERLKGVKGRYDTSRIVTVVGASVALLGAASGIAFILIDRPRPSKPLARIRAGLTVGGFALTGAWQ